MTTITKIPVLNDHVDELEAKAANAFLTAFFNVERLRDRLKRRGFLVGRSIAEDATMDVAYSIPKENGTGTVNVVLARKNPYATRDVLQNILTEKLAQIEHERKLVAAQKTLSTSLRPAEIETLKSLTPGELHALLVKVSGSPSAS